MRGGGFFPRSSGLGWGVGGGFRNRNIVPSGDPAGLGGGSRIRQQARVDEVLGQVQLVQSPLFAPLYCVCAL